MKNLWVKIDPIALFGLLEILNRPDHIYRAHQKKKIENNGLSLNLVFGIVTYQRF